MTRLEHLRQLARRLSGLIDDPQEGLMTWNNAMSRVLTELAAYAPLPAAREAEASGSDSLVSDGETRTDQPTGRA